MTSRKHLQGCELALFSHIRALDHIELSRERRNGVDNDGRKSGERVHLVDESPTAVIQHIEIVDRVEIYGGRNGLPDREARQSVLFAHNEKFTHSNSRLELGGLAHVVLKG